MGRNFAYSKQVNIYKPLRSNSLLVVSMLCLLGAFMVFSLTLDIKDIITGMICIFSGLFLTYFFKRRYHDWLNPATILSFVWICVFGLSYFGDIVPGYEGSVYDYDKPSKWTIMLVFVSYAFFIFGILMASKKTKILYYRNTSFFKRFQKNCNLQFVKMTTIILFIIGFSFYIFFVYKNEWIIPILAGMPRGRVELPVLAYFSMLLRVTPVLGVVYCCILYRSKGKISILMLAISVVSMLTLFTNVQRMEVMTSLIMVFVAIYYLLMDKKIRILPSLLILLLLFASFYSILYLRAKAFNFERNYLLATYNDTGAAFRNLSYVLETQTPHYKPLATIQFLDAFFGHRLRIAAVQEQLAIFNNYGLISTYLAWIYLDFGILGCIAIPFVLGIVTGLGYTYMITRPNIFTLFFNAILAMGVFTVARQFKFTATTEIVFYPVVGYLVYWVTKARYKKCKESNRPDLIQA